MSQGSKQMGKKEGLLGWKEENKNILPKAILVYESRAKGAR
jgi:hypothetical protein